MTIEPNEQGAVGPARMQSTWCTLSKHVKLMTQNQNFSFKPPLLPGASGGIAVNALIGSPARGQTFVVTDGAIQSIPASLAVYGMR